ncbi:hypothetical protein ACIPYQ_05080 [Streptomyces sp. NPDC090045]|uniref:hypothetical protein n=1 Tax=Streptomyces sp. NPDC090045 TaxID=3365927 RepID=UPI00381F87C2
MRAGHTPICPHTTSHAIGGARLARQVVREHRGRAWIGARVITLSLSGFVATLQPHGYRPDHWDAIGALVRPGGTAVITYAPRGRRAAGPPGGRAAPMLAGNRPYERPTHDRGAP